MAVAEIDARRVETFAGTIFGTINGAYLTLAVGLGHTTGHYDVLAQLEPSTSPEIARGAGLQERFVREWLAGQLAGGIAEHDPESGTWWLPREHALFLTRAADGGRASVPPQRPLRGA